MKMSINFAIKNIDVVARISSDMSIEMSKLVKKAFITHGSVICHLFMFHDRALNHR